MQLGGMNWVGHIMITIALTEPMDGLPLRRLASEILLVWTIIPLPMNSGMRYGSMYRYSY